MKLEFIWHKISFFLGSKIEIDSLHYSRINKCINVLAVRFPMKWELHDPREYSQKKIWP